MFNQQLYIHGTEPLLTLEMVNCDVSRFYSPTLTHRQTGARTVESRVERKLKHVSVDYQAAAKLEIIRAFAL